MIPFSIGNLNLQERLMRGHTALMAEPELDCTQISGFKLKFLSCTLLQLHSCPQNFSTPCATSGPQGLIAKAVSGSDQGMSAESCRVRIGQPEFPTLGEAWAGERELGKGELNVGFQVEGSWAWRGECSTLGGFHGQLPGVQGKELRQNEKASCLGPTESWEKLKLCFSNFMCTLITWGTDYNSVGLGWGLRLHFQQAPKQRWWPHREHHSQTPQPKSMARTDHWQHHRITGKVKQPKREQRRHELWEQTKFPFLPVGWPRPCQMESHEEHWCSLFGKSISEMLVGASFPSPVTDKVIYTGFEARQSWVQTPALLLSRCVVLDLSFNLCAPQFPHLQKYKWQHLPHRITVVMKWVCIQQSSYHSCCN